MGKTIKKISTKEPKIKKGNKKLNDFYEEELEKLDRKYVERFKR
jgi:hypothetical protein